MSYSSHRRESALTVAQTVHILLVEDSPADIELTRQALTEAEPEAEPEA
jgi:hypothetical protein